MVKKLQKISDKKSAESAGTNPLSSAVKESAQQIWLAGLGAFSKAQQEGSKAFEGLVKEGLSVQRKTQAVAEDRISDATSRMTSMANDITAKASGQWDKLETIFEDRVARTLNKLGVPSAKDIDALIARIDELNLNVQKLQSKPAAKAVAEPAAEAKPTTKPTTKRAPARKAAGTAVKPAEPSVAPAVTAVTTTTPVKAKRAAPRKTAKAAQAAQSTTATTPATEA
jgi:poly(hydroxyalkanoate) granule-associated protein